MTCCSGQRFPKTHDYSWRAWGHDYVFDPVDGGQQGKMMGWGLGISDGDYLILQDPKGGTTRYRVVSIRYLGDPKDMWDAEVEFAPR